MNAPEFYLYEPIYVDPLNNVFIPFVNDMFTSLYNIVVSFYVILFETSNIIYHTSLFIINEAITFVNIHLSFTEKILVCFCLYNLILLFITDIIYFNDNQQMQSKINRLESEMEELQKQVRKVDETTIENIDDIHVDIDRIFNKLETLDTINTNELNNNSRTLLKNILRKIR